MAEHEKYEYPYSKVENAALNWVTAGGRNTPHDIATYLKWTDDAIVSDMLECWILELTPAEAKKQLAAVRAEFASTGNLDVQYDPKHPPKDKRKDHEIVNGIDQDAPDVVIPADQPRRAAI